MIYKKLDKNANCQKTSDLQTDNQEVQSFSSKRKANVPRRYISSEEEESVDNRPPKLKKTFLNTIEIF